MRVMSPKQKKVRPQARPRFNTPRYSTNRMGPTEATAPRLNPNHPQQMARVVKFWQNVTAVKKMSVL